MCKCLSKWSLERVICPRRWALSLSLDLCEVVSLSLDLGEVVSLSLDLGEVVRNVLFSRAHLMA